MGPALTLEAFDVYVNRLDQGRRNVGRVGGSTVRARPVSPRAVGEKRGGQGK